MKPSLKKSLKKIKNSKIELKPKNKNKEKKL